MRPDDPSILTINGGSSTIKFAEYQLGKQLKRTTAGVISTDGSRVTLRVNSNGRRSDDCAIGVRHSKPTRENGKERP